MTQVVRKAVFPVAGLGTRFLPATKANPKEMLPIVDKPLIQYAAEEAVAAGITELIFVTGRNKRAIPDHFDKTYELEAELAARNKHRLLEEMRTILPSHVTCIYIRQSEPLGLGHAVLCAKSVVGDEPFAVSLADDLINDNGAGCLSQMVDAFREHGSSVLAVQPVSPSDTDKYGIVKTTSLEGRVSQVEQIVEKPKPDVAPSNLGVVGRYVLEPEIFGQLEQTGKGAGNEIQLTDAISSLLDERRVLALEFVGRRYDCGSKLGYLEATVDFALKHPELGDDFRKFLKSIN